MGNAGSKKQPLPNGFVNLSTGWKDLIKLRNTTVWPSKYKFGKKDHSIMSRNGAMLFGSSVLMNFTLLLAIIMAISLLMQKKLQNLQPAQSWALLQRNGPITPKVDIYSIGVLLLEIFCGRKNVKLSVEDENQIRLADGAYDKYKEGRLDLLVKNDEEAINGMKRVEMFVMTASWCIQADPLLRPSMKNVLQVSEGAMEVSVPPYTFPTTSV
uniref:Uncharacterized protein n=1 Tax=Quercus lobata TaxID=97700 RepID=A0A7N2QX35_QUELO